MSATGFSMTLKVTRWEYSPPIPATHRHQTLSPICLCLPCFLSLPVSRVWCVPHHSPRTACYHSNTGDREQENYRKTEMEWERVRVRKLGKDRERSGCVVYYLHASICIPLLSLFPNSSFILSLWGQKHCDPHYCHSKLLLIRIRDPRHVSLEG